MNTINSWVKIDENSDFSIYNIPFGIGKNASGNYFACSAIGDYVVDLRACFDLGFFEGIAIQKSSLTQKKLNDFIAHGKPITTKVRTRIQEILTTGHEAEVKGDQFLKKASEIDMQLPVSIGD